MLTVALSELEACPNQGTTAPVSCRVKALVLGHCFNVHMFFSPTCEAGKVNDYSLG